MLAGDYLLSKAMLLLSNPEDHLILQEMLGVAMAMSEGELLQSEKLKVKSEEWGKREEELRMDSGLVDPKALEFQKYAESYLNIIERKTARLICSCCVGGALSATSNLLPLTSNLISTFGLNLGLVFQMRDDILDHDDPETTAMAERLLPKYLEKTLQGFDALGPVAKHPEVLDSFRELVTLSAERNS